MALAGTLAEYNIQSEANFQHDLTYHNISSDELRVQLECLPNLLLLLNVSFFLYVTIFSFRCSTGGRCGSRGGPLPIEKADLEVHVDVNNQLVTDGKNCQTPSFDQDSQLRGVKVKAYM